MKTTVEISDDLYRRAKAEAALRGRKLRELVEEGLRLVLQSSRNRAARHHVNPDSSVLRGRPVLHHKPTVIVGIDLAGSPRRPTGVCILRGMKAYTRLAYLDEEILSAVDQTKPDLVPIDAPLSLPNGRKTIHDRSGEHLRECDRELLRRRIRFFPITLGSMRMLTERGLALKAKLDAMRYRVVECYPGAAQDVWGIPRQRQDLKGLLLGLTDLGVRGLTTGMTSDELDAATAALVGRWFLLGRGEMLGGEDGIVMPMFSKHRHRRVQNEQGPR